MTAKFLSALSTLKPISKDDWHKFIMERRMTKERNEEFKRVVNYAYHDSYETDECLNLLKSKGFTQYSLKDVIEQYDVIYCEEEGEE